MSSVSDESKRTATTELNLYVSSLNRLVVRLFFPNYCNGSWPTSDQRSSYTYTYTYIYNEVDGIYCAYKPVARSSKTRPISCPQGNLNLSPTVWKESYNLPISGSVRPLLIPPPPTRPLALSGWPPPSTQRRHNNFFFFIFFFHHFFHFLILNYKLIRFEILTHNKFYS